MLKKAFLEIGEAFFYAVLRQVDLLAEVCHAKFISRIIFMRAGIIPLDLPVLISSTLHEIYFIAIRVT